MMGESAGVATKGGRILRNEAVGWMEMLLGGRIFKGEMINET